MVSEKMKPYPLHFIILVVLALPGGILYLQTYSAGYANAGLFSADAFTKVYWAIYGLYVLISTLIVVAVHLIMRVRKHTLKGWMIFIVHILPVGLLWLGIQVGIHDIIDNRLRAVGSLEQYDKSKKLKKIDQKRRNLVTPKIRKKEYKQPGNSISGNDHISPMKASRNEEAE